MFWGFWHFNVENSKLLLLSDLICEVYLCPGKNENVSWNVLEMSWNFVLVKVWEPCMKVTSEFSLEIALENVKLSTYFWHYMYVVFRKSSRVDFLALRTFQVIWRSAAGNTVSYVTWQPRRISQSINQWIKNEYVYILSVHSSPSAYQYYSLVIIHW